MKFTNKYFKFVVIFGFIILVIGSLQLNHFMTQNDIENMQPYKTTIEKSFKNGEFTQEKKIVEDSFRYEIIIEKNTISLEYNSYAEKGRAFTKNILTATEHNNTFTWSCKRTHPMLPDFSC